MPKGDSGRVPTYPLRCSQTGDTSQVERMVEWLRKKSGRTKGSRGGDGRWDGSLASLGAQGSLSSLQVTEPLELQVPNTGAAIYILQMNEVLEVPLCQRCAWSLAWRPPMSSWLPSKVGIISVITLPPVFIRGNQGPESRGMD